MPLLETSGLTKQFGGLVAVDTVDFSVEPREIRAIIGPNGAGKTTLFNLLTGTYEATSGEIRFKDTDITDEPEHRRPYLGISRGYQVTNTYDSMTVFENVQTAVAMVSRNYYNPLDSLDDDVDTTEQAEEIISRLGLDDQRDVEADSLPHGDRRRLEIGMALAAEPDLLLLDEPTAGMDAGETERTMALIEQLSSEMAVLLVEHDIEHVMAVSDRILVLERGNVIADATPENIKNNQKVREAYLGGGEHA
jgi:branched-chain amino acid transport system ATP-binding protein